MEFSSTLRRLGVCSKEEEEEDDEDEEEEEDVEGLEIFPAGDGVEAEIASLDGASLFCIIVL